MALDTDDPDPDDKTVPVGCVVGLVLLIVAHVWLFLGAWPIGPHVRDWARRHPVILATGLFAYGGYLLREARAIRRHSPSSAVAKTDTQWGVGMVAIGVLLVVLEVTSWLLARGRL
jgi:hypothetical protein